MTSLPQVILLFVTDQFRNDAFDPAITPNLCNLASTSTTFLNSYVSAPTCTPARAGLLTGKSPWNHGLLGAYLTVNCEEYPTTLPEILDGMGYKTSIVGKNHFGVNTTSGAFISQGYREMNIYDGSLRLTSEVPDDYYKWFYEVVPGVDPLATCSDIFEDGLQWNDWESCAYGFDEFYHPTSWTTRVALEQIDSFNTDDENERLFLKVSYHRPHSPYDPPERLFEKHMALSHEEKYGRVIQNDSWDREWINTTRMSRAAYNGDPGDVKARQSRAVYYANVEFVDEGVGQILDALQAKNLLDDTFVAWVTDHGDMNGDHNLWRKGYPYEGAAHVRMLMKLPGQTEGKVSNAIVELRDVAPTLYDLLGTLQGIQARDPLINGQSLMPILQGEATKVREVLDLEHSKVYDDRMHWNALIGYDGNHELYKYIYFARGKEQLFCLSNDPNEHNDLSEDIAKVEYWRRLLVKQFQDEERGEEWVVSNGNLVANRAPIQFGPNFPCTTPTIPDALENNFARDDYRDTLNGVILQSIQLIICLYVLIS